MYVYWKPESKRQQRDDCQCILGSDEEKRGGDSHLCLEQADLQWYGFTETYQIRGNGLLNATDAAGRKDLLDQATTLAEKIVA